MTPSAHYSPCRRNRLWLVGGLLLYLALTTYQLGLPGLHYDEAREAGVNAMEILTAAPASLFRDTGISLFGYRWPIMVQDYIGAANVYLVLPSLWLTGIGVPNLRIVAILLGMVTLLLVERTLSEWQAYSADRPLSAQPLPLSTVGLLGLSLLTVSPSFVFWSRQGIFVTNLTEPLVFAMLWQGIRWLRLGRPRFLLWAAFFGGAALYAKLLAIWVVGPAVLLLGGWWLVRWRRASTKPTLTLSQIAGLFCLFCLPLVPLVWFNFASGGTFRAVAGNLGTSYYGVNNLAVGTNLVIRLGQLRQMLTGEHFWYLGGLYGNPLAWWLAIFLFGAGVIFIMHDRRSRARLWAPLLLLCCAFVASLFTLSDLFVTHYALLQPLAISLLALILCDHHLAPPQSHRAKSLLLVLWVLLDLTATVRYHGALTRSGGLADHSDANYHLAYYLQYNGLGAPLALDWGFDAPIRYLSGGAVTPIELFGYSSPQQPDATFGERLLPFLHNEANVYLLHTAEATVFAGRREQFMQLVERSGQQARLEATFGQRDGIPLYELWRVSEK